MEANIDVWQPICNTTNEYSCALVECLFWSWEYRMIKEAERRAIMYKIWKTRGFSPLVWFCWNGISNYLKALCDGMDEMIEFIFSNLMNTKRRDSMTNRQSNKRKGNSQWILCRQHEKKRIGRKKWTTERVSSHCPFFVSAKVEWREKKSS